MDLTINSKTFLENIALIQGYLQEGKQYTLTIKERRKHRSTNANAYMWTLCDRLADKLGMTKEQVYRNAIKDVGVYDAFCVQNKALDSVIEHWQSRGTGWVCEVVDDAKNVKDAKVLFMYYGSSTYDTKEMSRLIKNIIQDCKEQGIETMTPDEINELIARWGDDKQA